MEEHFLLKLLLLEQLVLKLIGFHIAKYSLTGKREYLTSGHFPLKMITFSYGFWSYFRCLLCNPRSSYLISWRFVHLLHRTRDHNHHPSRMLCMHVDGQYIWCIGPPGICLIVIILLLITMWLLVECVSLVEC